MTAQAALPLGLGLELVGDQVQVQPVLDGLGLEDLVEGHPRAAGGRLAQRGVDVAGIERQGIGHHLGSSHGVTRFGEPTYCAADFLDPARFPCEPTRTGLP
jgi:hypothetical protein